MLKDKKASLIPFCPACGEKRGRKNDQRPAQVLAENDGDGPRRSFEIKFQPARKSTGGTRAQRVIKLHAEPLDLDRELV